MQYELHHGDCLDVLKTMPDNCIDSVVCDPPYGLSFMGKKWDYDVPAAEVWAECLRVLKPGGHLLAFAGTRTQHRMAVRIEDAGFEVRDMIFWCYGSGFPKSRNIANDMDGADAAAWQGWGTALKPSLEPVTVARKPLAGTVAANVLQHGTGALNIDGCRVNSGPVEIHARTVNITTASSMSGTSTGSTGTGEFNTGRWPANLLHDGSDEVLAGFPVTGASKSGGKAGPIGYHAGGNGADRGGYDDNGGSAARFFQQCKGDDNELWQDLNLPQENANTAEQSSSQQRQSAVSALVLAANLALPEGLFCKSLLMEPSTSATGIELRRIAEIVTQTIQSIESRFWRESKPARLTLSLSHASDAEIQRLTDTTTITVSRWRSDGSAEPVTFSITQQNSEAGEKDCAPSTDGKRFMYCAKASKKDRGEGNGHPTVKPIDLMAYLCRLVTPPGGVVLDPFMGSGSTGKAALREAFRFIGIEREAEYLAIAEARIKAECEKQTKQPSVEQLDLLDAA